MSSAIDRAKAHAVARATEDITARAEIAIEKILKKLQADAGRKIKLVSVDIENHSTPSVEIFWRS